MVDYQKEIEALQGTTAQLKNAVTVLQKSVPGDHTDISNLQADVAKLKNDTKSTGWGPIASRQPIGTSAQWVGNGSLQLLNPSFSAATVSYSGFLKIDETGWTVFGKHHPWNAKTAPVTKAEFDLTVAELVKTTVLNARLAVLVRDSAFKAQLSGLVKRTTFDKQVAGLVKTTTFDEAKLHTAEEIARVDRRFGGIGTQTVAQAIGVVKTSLTKFKTSTTEKFELLEEKGTHLAEGQTLNAQQAEVAAEKIKALELAVEGLTHAIGE